MLREEAPSLRPEYIDELFALTPECATNWTPEMGT